MYREGDGLYKKEAVDILNNIGFILKRKGEFSQALEYYQICLKVCIANYSPGHSAIAGALNYVGNTLIEQKNYEEAKNYINESLMIYNAIGVGKNKERAACYASLALCARELGEKDSSLSNCKRAIEIGEDVYAKTPKILCILLSNHADTLEHFGLLEEALE